MGRVPVYIYDDRPWLPYDYPGSTISLNRLGYMGQLGSLPHLVHTLKAVSNATLLQKLAEVKRARRFYTMEGVLEQIGLFVGDPLGDKGGHLRCSVKPTELASVLDVSLRV